MTAIEQEQWLFKNGFEEDGHQGNKMFFKKQVGGVYNLVFEWYNGGRNYPPEWTIYIYSIEDRDNLIYLVSNIPNDEHFNKFQPLIDLITG